MSETYVSSGTVSKTTVSGGSTLYVLSSGITEFTTVLSGGTQFVYDGGAASFSSVDDGGFLFVSGGGTAQGGAINSGGDAYIAAGGAAYGALVAAAGELDVIGGTASGINVSGGRMFVESNGQATSTKVQSGGALYVSAFGSAGLTDVYISGLLYVGYNGTASASTVNSGGEDYVDGTDAATTVNAGGLLYVGNGTASGSMINAGGVAEVASDGTLGGATVEGGASLFNSGTATNISVIGGGYEFIAIGGAQTGTTIASNGAVVIAGQDHDATVSSGGMLFVGPGGFGIDTDVGTGGFAEVFGSGSTSGDLTGNILSGGVAVVGQVGGFMGTVDAGGTVIVADRFYSDITASAGAHVISTGIAILNRPGFTVETAQSIDGETLSNGAEIVYVLSSGTANYVTVAGSAIEQVYGGGTANNDVVDLAQIDVFTGAVLSDTSILGGNAFVSGGTMYDATISSGGGNYGFLTLIGGETSGTTVYAGGDEVMQGGNAFGIAFGTTIDSGGEQDIYGSLGTAAGAVIFNGGIEFAISRGVASNTTIAGGALNLVSGGAAYGGIHFTNSDGILFIESTDLPSTTISGFGASDSIELTDLTYNSSDQVTVGTPGIVTISVAGTHYDLNIAGAASNTPYYLAAGAEDTGLVLLDSANAPCFAAGTRILTPRGEVAVEQLDVGDAVITRDGEDAPIIWIGHRRIDLTRHPHPQQARPIRIAANALAEGVPRRDLLLSPDHALFIGGALIPAKALLNDRNIRQFSPTTITYFHIELAEHNVIFAENCAVETYLETGNRGAFANGTQALTLHPDLAQTQREQNSCAPFTDSGPTLEAAREQTMRRHYEMRRKGSSAF